MLKAKYTIVLKQLLDDPEARAKIDQALSKYPLYEKKSKEQYKPSYIPTREELNSKILNYYKYREIGFETFGRFLDELETAMQEIMPYYNELFFSADQDYNIIFNVDYQRTTTRKHESESENEANTTDKTVAKTTTVTEDEAESNGKNVRATEPQDLLQIPANGVDSLNYANEADWSKGTTKTFGETEADTDSSTTGTAKGTASAMEEEETQETTKGNFGVVSSQDLIEKFRSVIINIEQQIINDPRIVELFMLVY